MEGDLTLPGLNEGAGRSAAMAKARELFLNLEGYVRSPTLELGVTEGDLT